jgi:hypothetical protein
MNTSVVAATFFATCAVSLTQYTVWLAITKRPQRRGCGDVGAGCEHACRYRRNDRADPPLQLNPPEVRIECRTMPIITAVKNSQMRGTRFEIQFILVTL